MYNIVILGSGNVATHLSVALKNAGHNIMQVFSRNIENASLLASRVGAQAVDAIDDIITNADAYIISVKDDALEDVVSRLASRVRGLNTGDSSQIDNSESKTNEDSTQTVGSESSEALLIHTAGSISIEVLERYAVNCGVLYPMQTFSKAREVCFSEVPCFIEANNENSLAMVKMLADSISDKVQMCDSQKRKKLHLAAVFACNLTNHCYRLAEKVLEEDNLDFSLFLPLIDETARKVREMSPRKAQTGPMVRYDKKVMSMQMEMLPDSRTKEIYRLMSESIHEDSQLSD